MIANQIEIQVNGERRQIPLGFTVTDLLALLNMDSARVAVELNRQIIRRTAWAETRLPDGAVLEVVQFVGGG